MTKNVKFYIFTAIVAVVVFVSSFIVLYRNGIAKLEAEEHSRPTPFRQRPTVPAQQAQGQVITPAKSRPAADKQPLYQAYDGAADGNGKLVAIINLVAAINDSKTMAAEDRNRLRSYFNDGASTIDGKKIILLCIHEVKDSDSIDWLIDSAADEKGDELREKILIVLLATDRKSTLVRLAEKSAADQKYNGVKSMAERLNQGR